MCFSAGASFTGGVLLSSIGAATLKNVRTPSQQTFASIPLLFGVQQIAEGFLWMALPQTDSAAVQNASAFLFLVMARVLWPTMMPLSVLLMEEHEKKKKILLIPLVMGAAVSLYYTYCLLFLHVTPQISGRHIQYISDYPEALAVPVFIIYFIASIVPLFISSIHKARILGGLMFISGVVTVIFFTHYLTSVWCFFAALISSVIYWILKDSNKEIQVSS